MLLPPERGRAALRYGAVGGVVQPDKGRNMERGLQVSGGNTSRGLSVCGRTRGESMKRDREVCWACGNRFRRLVLGPEELATAKVAYNELCDKGIWSCPRITGNGKTIHWDISGDEVPDDCPYKAEQAVCQ